MALYFSCRINKNALFRLFFLAILPTGNIYLYFKEEVYTQSCKISLNVI